MKGIQLSAYVKAPSELKITELPDPKPAADEYLIEVHAAATNFFDILQIQGKYQHQPRMCPPVLTSADARMLTIVIVSLSVGFGS